MTKDKTLAVYCWSPHVQAEGVIAVLDNLQEAGVGAVSTTIYVAEPSAPGPGVRREPPEDGGRGLSRIVDRPLWGKQEQFLRVGPAFQHDRSLFENCQLYSPSEPNDLTASQGHVVAEFISEAKRRGMTTYIQISPSGRPPHRDNLTQQQLDSETPRLPNGKPPGERMVNFPPLASPELQSYNTAIATDVLRTYPELDGLLLDRMEQSVYSFDDAFIDFGVHAERFARENGYDFEALRKAAQSAIDSLQSLSNEDLAGVKNGSDIPYVLAAIFRDSPGLAELLRFRASLTANYLGNFRTAADSVRPGVQLVPITFPPPLSLLTGVNFNAYSSSADAVMIKFFTMHWPLIVTYWTESITNANPSLDSGLVARAVSVLFDMEDEPSSNLADYVFPGPDDAHRAGTEAQARKITQTTAEVGNMPILPSVHAYGPMDDVERRWRIGWETGKSGMWVNRYGYLSQEKLDLLKRVTS